MKANSPVKILLVDDLPENLFALELILSNNNYKCVKANSGNDALKILLHEQDFALLLMDVQMPAMDGFETVELIREIETLKHVPIIFLTASMDNSMHVFKGYQAGAIDYMVKPLIPEILNAKVAVFVELYLKTHELLVQNDEKEKRAAELGVANKELAFQNDEKEKRAAELEIANKELAFLNEEKEKQAELLRIANRELLSFTYISSHDMQEPLRKIQTFISIILKEEKETLSHNGKDYFQRIQSSAERMQKLIIDLLAYSRINVTDRKFEKTELSIIIDDVKEELKDTIKDKNATIDAVELGSANIIPFQFRQLIYNLMSNALKFSRVNIPSLITIKSKIIKGSKLNVEKKLLPEKNYCHITFKDNGIGFEPQFSEHVFGVFQKLHSKDVYMGTGIGLAIVKKIVENHNGIITATSELNKGATFDIYIPANLREFFC